MFALSDWALAFGLAKTNPLERIIMKIKNFFSSFPRITSLIYLIILQLLWSQSAFAGTWQSEQTIGGKLRTHLYVPNSTPFLNDQRALMVNLHGCGQTHSDLKSGGNWKNVADDYGMVVAIPKASGEGTSGAILGCWNFHVGMNADRTQTDALYLLNMVSALLDDASLNIDPDQVYVTGFSAGASMANQMACLAPDVFSGVGVSAGLQPGADGDPEGGFEPAVEPFEQDCITLAGSFQSHLDTQIYNHTHGSNDSILDPANADQNVKIFQDVYASLSGTVAEACSSGTLPGGGDLTTYCDNTGPRISKLIVNGLAHAWSAGQSSTGSTNYIDHNHVDYPAYITEFFMNNNRRTVIIEPTPEPTTFPTPFPSTPTATPEPTIFPTPYPHNCEIITATNWEHKLAGRAYSTGLWWAPNYYAEFSNEFMPGSTWGETTLYSPNGAHWYVSYACLP